MPRRSSLRAGSSPFRPILIKKAKRKQKESKKKAKAKAKAKG
jgi:hypothetical protein